MDEKKKLHQIKLSDLYWCFGILFTLGFIILHYVRSIFTGKLEFLWVIIATIIFIASLLIAHNKKIRDNLDYE